MQRPTQLQTPFFRIPQGTRYEAPQAMQKRTQTTSTNLFKTPQAHQLTSRQQQQEVVRERECLTYAPALAKLKLEADKIRKWKTATQFELKKKESQLVEVREQLKVQQETVTSMRVREEGLKTRLQDQVSSHTEIQHKILVTRGLCSTLKEKVEQCEAALKQGQADQKDNMDLDNLRMEQYRALANKFKELEQQQAEFQRSLEEALMTERERGCGLDKELTNERAQCAQLCTENTALQEELTAIRREEVCVRGHLEEAQRRLHEEEGVREEAERQCQQLQQQLHTSQEHSQTLQTTITSLHEEMSSLKSDHSAVVSSMQQELSQSVQMCSDLRTQAQQYSQTVDTQQAQLASAARERENMETALASLREELCAMEYSRRDDVTELQRQLREKEAAHVEEVTALQTSLTAVQASHTALQQQLLETETGCVAKEKAMVELSHSLEEKEAVRVELRSEVTGLQDHVKELEREREERRGEREREKKEADTTTLSLTTELETLRKQFDDHQRTEGERVSKLESENGELTKELAEMRQKCEEAVQGKEEQQRSSEAILAEVRSQSAREVERCREEADRARETQLREKEGFDTQVTELCGMLEKYRSENNKIVQQKDLQIHSLQSSLADANKAKESLEEMVRGAQEEGLGLQEEVERLQQVMREREEEAKEREARVTEKEREMAELLKAIDTLRSKQQQSEVCTPQSTSHTTSHPPPSPPAHSPHTPHMAIVSSMAPLTAPTKSTLHSLRRQRSSRTGTDYHTRTTPHTPMLATPSVTYATPSRPASLRPAVKKVRREETDTESEDILFRKPHPLASRSKPQHCKEPDMLSGRREGGSHLDPSRPGGGASHLDPSRPGGGASHLDPSRPGGGYSSYSSPSVSAAGSVSDHEVTSTGISKKVKSTPARGRSGRGRRGRERKVTGGERKQAGTAWFDLDAVFGFGPED